jgi:Mg2+ and Co2+ transporter CorA
VACRLKRTLSCGGGQERLNRTLQTLTAVSVVAIPAQLLTGYFGMNFEGMWLMHWEHGYALFWAAVAACTAGCALWFRRAMRPPAPDAPPHPPRYARRLYGSKAPDYK